MDKNKGARKISQFVWFEILRSFDFKCAYCGVKTTALTADHFIPLALGGLTVPENYVPACTWCNSRKGGKHPRNVLSVNKYNDIKSKLKGWDSLKS